MFGPLVGKRCRLRDFTQRDLAEFARYRAIPEVARFQSWTDYSLADAQKLFIAQAGTRFGRDGSWYQVAIAANQDGALLGDCALHFLEDGRQLEIGFTVAPEHQGRGIAREALSLLLDHVFGTMKKYRVIAVTDAENVAAQKLLASLGFRKEAHYRENVFFKGRWGDECLFACLASEWPKN
jgi:RimJ/RimL family protein N-acetyltransferase